MGRAMMASHTTNRVTVRRMHVKKVLCSFNNTSDTSDLKVLLYDRQGPKCWEVLRSKSNLNLNLWSGIRGSERHYGWREMDPKESAREILKEHTFLSGLWSVTHMRCNCHHTWTSNLSRHSCCAPAAACKLESAHSISPHPSWRTQCHLQPNLSSWLSCCSDLQPVGIMSGKKFNHVAQGLIQ